MLRIDDSNVLGLALNCVQDRFISGMCPNIPNEDRKVFNSKSTQQFLVNEISLLKLEPLFKLFV